MKKFLLILLAVSFSTAYVNAQEITASDAPEPGLKIAAFFDGETEITPGPGGENLSWDFSHLNPQVKDTLEFVSPSSVSGYLNYPEATVAIDIEGEEGQFMQINSSGFYELNHSMSYHFSTNNEGSEDYFFYGKFIPARKLMEFPATYNKKWKSISTARDSAAGTGEYFDSIRVSTTIKDSIVVDAYGTVSTPEGVYSNAIRVANYRTKTTRTDMKTNDTWTIQNPSVQLDTNYRFWVPGKKYPVLELIQVSVQDTEGGSTVSSYSAAYYKNVDFATSILSPSYLNTSIYPNPAREEFFIPHAVNIISLTDASGTKVSFEEMKTDKGLKINLTNHKAGLYVVNVQYQDAVRVLKVTITE